MKIARTILKRVGVLTRSQFANSISFLGTIPVFVLLEPNYYIYFPLIAAFNILADDLDGIVARRLGTNSEKGRFIDVLCDAASHLVLLMAAARNHGMVTKIVAMITLVSMINRLASSSNKEITKFNGTTTNECIVALHLVIVMELAWGINLEILLVPMITLSILTLNIKAKVTTLRRVMNDKTKLAFDLLLIVSSFLHGLALLLLSLHILIFLKSFVLIIVKKRTSRWKEQRTWQKKIKQ
jgi:phosphatidylserine synthase